MGVLRAVAAGILALTAVAAGVVAGGIVLLATLYGWNDARPLLAAQAGKALGREVRIEGNLSVTLADPLRIRIERLTIANEPWAADPALMTIAVLELELSVRPLLRGSWELPLIALSGPHLALETDPAGGNNWGSGPPSPQRAVAREAVPGDRREAPLVERLVIADGRVRYRDPERGVDVAARIDTATGGDQGERVRLDGDGTFAGKPFTLMVEGGSLRFLRDAPDPYPIVAEVAIGDTRGRLEGRVGDPLSLQGIDLSVALRGPDLADVFPILGIPAPRTAPYHLSGHLAREGAVWRLRGLEGGVGDSDLSGTIAVDTAGERPMVTGDLASRRLAAADLAGLVGASPRGRGDYPTKGGDRVIPATRVDLERLRAADMDVRFSGRRVEAPFAPLDDLEVRFRLEDGRLRLDPLRLGIAGSRIGGTAVVDGRGAVPDLRVDLRVRGARLAEFFQGTAFAEEMGGTVTGTVVLAGRGGSVADMLAAADGRVGLAVSGGRVTSLAEAGLKTNLLETLGILVSGDEPVRFNCLAADLAVADGIVRSDAIVLDTDETLIVATGEASLRDETLNLTIEGDSKEPQIFATHVPVIVRGPFLAPSVSADVGESLTRGAVAVALGVLLTPLAGILATADSGTEGDADCATLAAKAKRPGGAGGPGKR